MVSVKLFFLSFGWHANMHKFSILFLLFFFLVCFLLMPCCDDFDKLGGRHKTLSNATTVKNNNSSGRSKQFCIIARLVFSSFWHIYKFFFNASVCVCEFVYRKVWREGERISGKFIYLMQQTHTDS